MSGVNTRRRRRRLAITWGSAVGLGVLLALLTRDDFLGLGVPIPVLVGLRLLIVVALLGIQVYYWRALDEVARAIQATAFLWSGLAAWSLFILAVFLEPLIDPTGAMTGRLGALGGATLLVLVHLALYLVLWGWAWLKPR